MVFTENTVVMNTVTFNNKQPGSMIVGTAVMAQLDMFDGDM